MYRNVVKKSVSILNESCYSVPIRCSISLTYSQKLSLKDLALLDAHVICQGEKIPCKRQIYNEKCVHVLFAANPESELEYTISLYINEENPAEYAPYIGGGDYLASIGRGCTGPLHVGFCSIPTPVPWFSDAKRDLLVSTFAGRDFSPEVFLYRYIGMDDDRPLYSEGIRISFLKGMLRAVNRKDKLFDLISMQTDGGVCRFVYYKNFGTIGYPVFEELLINTIDIPSDLEDNIEIKHFDIICRGNVIDIVIAVCDASDYHPKGIDPRGKRSERYSPYDENGRWLGGDVKGALYKIPDILNNKDISKSIEKISQCDIDGMCGICISDDGEFYVTDDIDRFYKLKKSSGSSKLDSLAYTVDNDGDVIFFESHFYRLACVSYTDDDSGSILAGCEDGSVYYLKNMNQSYNDSPVFARPQKLYQQYPHISTGIGLSPTFAHWMDRDKPQLMIGDAAGFISCIVDFSKCTGSKRIVSENGLFRRIAGLSGSLQGPAERTWGYIGLSSFDFNGNGYDELLVSDVMGYHHILVNDNTDIFVRRILKVYHNDMLLKTAWRCRAACYRDLDGVIHFVAVDEGGCLSVYDIADAEHPNVLSNKRKLKYTDGSPIKLDGYAGLSGRIKIEVCNWYGKNDIIFGTKEGQHQSFNKLDTSSLFLLRNLGTEKSPVYEQPEIIKDQYGNPLIFGAHDPSPHVYDIGGCGQERLIVGGENGYLYIYSIRENKSLAFKDISI